ncbi:hypothetical protein DPMN_190454 [Dreissena polymorpha]|uniref:Uncharacterized protein n=1 Tax=Dreissena polymorpha TaxID=45954 RepID=A0A9D4IBR7_DREPO|nr:hypothetical protein DPMN_190454 [Dreissena polymorpha]
MDLHPLVHLSAMEPSLNNERIKIHQAETFTTKAQICGATPLVQEFHYMVKQGKQACDGLGKCGRQMEFFELFEI